MFGIIVPKNLEPYFFFEIVVPSFLELFFFDFFYFLEL